MSKHIEQFWRDATGKDVVDVMNGKEVEARFRDGAKGEWRNSRLTGWQGQLPYQWIGAAVGAYCECQVYDPPQWFINKPEPGEGYRLLGKFPDEPRQPKDDVFVDGTWRTTEGCGPQPETLWYRRRIEPPKPEPKHYTLQVGDTCDVPSGHRITITEHGVEVN